MYRVHFFCYSVYDAIFPPVDAEAMFKDDPKNSNVNENSDDEGTTKKKEKKKKEKIGFRDRKVMLMYI